MHNEYNKMQAFNKSHVNIKHGGFRLAFEDAKRAMAQDLTIKHSELIDFTDEDFTTQLYLHHENWDALEIQEFSKVVI